MTPTAIIVSLLMAAAGLNAEIEPSGQSVLLTDDGMPVLRYNHGQTTPPEGIGPEYRRADYVHPLYGLDGTPITDDYPADHPHHRGINWAWATIQWNGETRDHFAVRGITARPQGDLSLSRSDESLTIHALHQWMWDDTTPIVKENVTIEVRPKEERGRGVDFTIKLEALVDGLQFAGRLEHGYSGFNIRMAPGENQRIQFHTDPEDASPRRAWADYSATIGGHPGGLAILQHLSNPGYPHEWREYPDLNFFQPVYPGGALIPMPKGETITLRYRIWIHATPLDDATATALWDAYNSRKD